MKPRTRAAFANTNLALGDTWRDNEVCRTAWFSWSVPSFDRRVGPLLTAASRAQHTDYDDAQG